MDFDCANDRFIHPNGRFLSEIDNVYTSGANEQIVMSKYSVYPALNVSDYYPIAIDIKCELTLADIKCNNPLTQVIRVRWDTVDKCINTSLVVNCKGFKVSQII